MNVIKEFLRNLREITIVIIGILLCAMTTIVCLATIYAFGPIAIPIVVIPFLTIATFAMIIDHL